MLINDYTEKITGLKDIELISVENFNSTTVLEVFIKKQPHHCPSCNSLTSKVHDYRIQYVKDVPSFTSQVLLKVHKRRYVCTNCGKRFFEKVSFLPKYQRTSNRLWGFVLSELSSTQSMKDIAKRINISPTSVARIMDHASYGLNRLPEVISIDEFKGNSGGNKYQCILTNPSKHQVLDILPKRSVDSLAKYFSSFNDRNNVKYVVMDMSPVFRSMAQSCFPNAKIVADKFHVQRLVMWAFEDMRKTVQKEFYHTRRKYFKHSRWLLLKDRSKLTEDEFEQLSHMLEISKPLAQAYFLLHEFRKVIQSTSRSEAKKHLSDWFMHVGTTDSKVFRRFHQCVKTFFNWQEEILNAFETGFSNGFTEGFNNKIKVIKRNAYGMRNFDRFRKRILHISNA